MNVPLVMTPGQNNIPDIVVNIIIGIESQTYDSFTLVAFLHVALFMSIEMIFVCCVSEGDKKLWKKQVKTMLSFGVFGQWSKSCL